jgi:osmotically-inducible protein OsmY
MEERPDCPTLYSELVVWMKRSLMKSKWVVASSILALALVQGSSQTSGGGGTSGGATTSGGQNTGTAGQQPGVQNGRQVPPQQVPPGLQNRNELPPGLQNRDQLPPGLQRDQLPPGLAMRTNQLTGAATNQGFFTNRFAGRTNQFGANTNLSPTGNAGTNSVFSTNRFDFRNFDRTRFRDEAITPADQSLLIQIKQTITTEIAVSTSGGANWVPIHIAIDSGRVRLMGLVANADQAQRIQSLVSQMPGVSGVENALSPLPQDLAMSETDRVILAQIRQVIPLTPTGGAWMPVTFDVRQGGVAIAGIVPTVQESQRIETVVRQVPGVVQTSNTLVVDTPSGARATSTLAVPQR